MFDRMKMKLANNLGNFLSTTPPPSLPLEHLSPALASHLNNRPTWHRAPIKRIIDKRKSSAPQNIHEIATIMSMSKKVFPLLKVCVFFIEDTCFFIEEMCFLLRICVFYLGFFYWGCVFLSNWFECFFFLYLINSLSLCKNKHTRNGRKQHRHQRIDYALRLLHRSFFFVAYLRRKKLK